MIKIDEKPESELGNFPTIEKEKLLEAYRSIDRPDPENIQYVRENYTKLQEEYGDQFVIVVNGEVVESISHPLDEEEYLDTIRKLKEEYTEEAVNKLFIRYIQDPDMDYIY